MLDLEIVKDMVPSVELQTALPSESAGLWAVWTWSILSHAE